MIIIANLNNLWVVGKKNENTMDEPMMYIFSGTQHGCLPLPGNPDNVKIDKATFWYELKDGETKDIYLKSKSKIITPEVKLV
jgi:hypothetical protein